MQSCHWCSDDQQCPDEQCPDEQCPDEQCPDEQCPDEQCSACGLPEDQPSVNSHQCGICSQNRMEKAVLPDNNVKAISRSHDEEFGF
jgi:hypothetical protein